MVRVIYCSMVADLFHIGHLKFLKKVKEIGDVKLIIGLHPDDIVKGFKRGPIIPFKDRKEILEALEIVDLVVEDCMDIRSPTMFENLKKYNVDTLVHGIDFLPELYKQVKDCEIRLIDSDSDISTTEIINRIKIRKLGVRFE